MRVAIIVADKVDNIVEAEAIEVLRDIFPDAELAVASDATSIGDSWTGEEFIKPPPPAVNLEMIRAARNEQINRWREVANFSSFPHAGKLIACDSLSRSDIDGVANHISLFGAFPLGFPGAWKAIDNSLLEMPDIDAFKAMYASMTAQGAANFEHAQALKAALAEATTAEEVAAIGW